MEAWQYIAGLVAFMVTALSGFGMLAQSMSNNRTATEKFQDTLVSALNKNVQTLLESRRDPDYDKRIANLEVEAKHSLTQHSNWQAQIGVLNHSHANMKTAFAGLDSKLEEMPAKIVSLLRLREAK